MSKKALWIFAFAALVLAAAAGARAEERQLTLINIKYQGKIIWIPSPIVAKKGDKVKLTLLNLVPDDPAVHGFTIPEFNVKAEVDRSTPAVVEFTAHKAGLFDTNCHMHPAHLHGQLLVVE
jgi:heme/copper-type cytochrome/quinol oxidase subunit 2